MEEVDENYEVYMAEVGRGNPAKSQEHKETEQELIEKVGEILSQMCFDLIGGSDLCKTGRCQTGELAGLCSGLHRYRAQILALTPE